MPQSPPPVFPFGFVVFAFLCNQVCDVYSCHHTSGLVIAVAILIELEIKNSILGIALLAYLKIT